MRLSRLLLIGTLLLLPVALLARAAPAQVSVTVETPGATYAAQIQAIELTSAAFSARPGGKAWMASAVARAGAKPGPGVVAFRYWRDANGDGQAQPEERTLDVLLVHGNLGQPGSTLRGAVTISCDGAQLAQEAVTVYDGTVAFWRFGAPLGYWPAPPFCDAYFAPWDAGQPVPTAVRAPFVARASWFDETAVAGSQGSPGAVVGRLPEVCVLRAWGAQGEVLEALRWNVAQSLRARRLHYWREGATHAVHPWNAADAPGVTLRWDGKDSFGGRGDERPALLLRSGALVPNATPWDPQHCFRAIRHIVVWQVTGSLADWWTARAQVQAILSDRVAKDPDADLGNQRENGWPAWTLALWIRAARDPGAVQDAAAGLDVILTRLERLQGQGVAPWLCLNLNAGADHHGLPVSLFQQAVLQQGLDAVAALPVPWTALAARARALQLRGAAAMDWAGRKGSLSGLWAVDWDPRDGEVWTDGAVGGTRLWAAAAEAAGCLAEPAATARRAHLTDFRSRAPALRPTDKNFDPAAAAMVAAVLGWPN